MTKVLSFRGLTLTALAALTAASAPVQAAAPPAVRDGDPTPAACGRLGFQAYEEIDADGLMVTAQRRGGGLYKTQPRMAMAPAGVMPPPPSPPPPPMPGKMSGYAPQQPQDTERYPDAVSNPIRRVEQEPVSTFSIDVDTAAYSNVRRFLNEGTTPPRDSVRVEELVNYFDYAYPLPTRAEEPFAPFVAVAPSPWNAQRQIVHIGLQGYDIPRAEQPPLNLVFLVDTSGSMWSEDRLPLAKKALGVLIDQLRPQDRVAMVAYAGSAGAVLAPTGGDQKLKMRCALEALRSGGSTAGGEGLALAYGLAQQNFRKDAVNRVVLLTDGDFNVGVADPEKLEDFVAGKRKSGVYLSVYGFGRGNYNDVMMQTLSQTGNGTAAYIDTLEEARKLLRDDFAGSLFPIADDVKIQVEFNPALVSEYRLIGYETRMLAREDFNNDQVDAGEVGSGVSVTALYEIAPVGAAPSSDPLRYQSGSAAAQLLPRPELGYLKIRYKLPGEADSRLMQRPILPATGTLDAAPEATRWALAVAAFGQKLRGDPWLATSYGWDDVERLAQGARGTDPDGLRAEFVRLVRAAKETRAVNE